MYATKPISLTAIQEACVNSFMVTMTSMVPTASKEMRSLVRQKITDNLDSLVKGGYRIISGFTSIKYNSNIKEVTLLFDYRKKGDAGYGYLSKSNSAVTAIKWVLTEDGTTEVTLREYVTKEYT